MLISMKTFKLVITLRLTTKTNPAYYKGIYVHKIILLPFAPYIDMNLYDIDDVYEIDLLNKNGFSYSIKYKQFDYIDIKIFDYNNERKEYFRGLINAGWLMGPGYKGQTLIKRIER